MQRGWLQVSPKHKETQAMSIYLGIYRIALFWIWTVSADIFGWTYLYLYLYLNQCISICIWIKVEQNICICIWKIQFFLFVFVFDKTYLTPAMGSPVCDQWVKSLRPSDAIWWVTGDRDLGQHWWQVMACCLTALSHYLNQCWLIITKVLWCSSEGNFTWDITAISY